MPKIPGVKHRRASASKRSRNCSKIAYLVPRQERRTRYQRLHFRREVEIGIARKRNSNPTFLQIPLLQISGNTRHINGDWVFHRGLNMVHGIREAQKKKRNDHDRPLWSYSRSTAFRRIKEVMAAADLPAGPHLTPKGLRHSYGVHAIASGVPLNMLQKWLGHAMMETTAIYADAVGEEQQTIAARMWRSSQM